MQLAFRFDRRRLAIAVLLLGTCVTLAIGVSGTYWSMLALHVALMLATALGTWGLAGDDLAFVKPGSIPRSLLTGVCVGLALTWLAATIAALAGVWAGAHWAMGETPQVVHRFVADLVYHWTPLGLISTLCGTGTAIIVDELTRPPLDTRRQA